MINVLFISADREYSHVCRSALTKAGVRVVVRDDFIDGIRELNWFSADVIACDMTTQKFDAAHIQVLLRNRHYRRALLLIEDEFELVDEPESLTCDKISKSESSSVMVTKVSQLASGNVKQVPEKDESSK